MKAQSEKLQNETESINPETAGFGLSAFDFKLKIGFDGKRAANNLTGLGNYSRSLIGHLANQFPENEYLVFTPKINDSLKKSWLFKLPNVFLKLPYNKRKFFWRSYGITKDLVNNKVDLFHGLSHEIPFGLKSNGIKSIVTIHDLIFLRYPQYYKLIDRIIYAYKSKYACKKADKIIAISEQTKADLIALYKVEAAKIEVIYQSCDDNFKHLLPTETKEKVSKKYQLPTKYLLSVGTIEERKNLLLIIKALPKINENYSLVIIGKETPYANLVKAEIEKLGLQNRVLFLKNIPFEDFPAIYQQSSVFVYPSFYEGFGIPIIEALYSGTPVVAAKGSCLEEAGGPSSKYILPDNENELANAINEILSNEQMQTEMIKNGLKFVQRFNNDVVSNQVMNCYLKTLSK